jgi:arylsulfatase
MDGVKVGEGVIDRTYPSQVPINETFDIGRDNGTSPSRDYQVPFVFTGRIEQVDVAVAAGQQ